MVFSTDTGIFDAISSVDIESASLLNPTSFPSLVLATDKTGHSNSSEKPRPHPEPHQHVTVAAKDRRRG
jgi:hypothetical protein